MDIFIYCIIGIIGILFGSFFTLAVYRIPLGEDITHTRSYCPKCKHKLGFWDLIPVLSYIFLGGKCRYCKETISRRYIAFELLSGLMFVLLALSMQISMSNIIVKLPVLTYNILFLAIIIMIVGMAKESNVLNISTIMFGILFHTIYLAIFDLETFRVSFINTAELLLILLIIYAIILIMKSSKLNNFLGLSLFISLIAYNYGLTITLVIIAISFICKLIDKYILKKGVNLAVYIGILSIFILLTKNIDFLSKIYENISGWII